MNADAVSSPHALPLQLFERVLADDLDGALALGLMEYCPAQHDAVDPAVTATLLAAQQRLQTAWAARQRYQARTARLQRRAAERDARRAPAPTQPAAPALPPLAAAILARAKAKASGGAST
ncbi:hypothetical protein [Xanthomonas campestris]|uniref:hypothetical protein n=1 Tax=Xanthomonas campestris TaxID=339 RepID=UPI0023E9CAED|nr:Na+-translocating ferredoxin:NAD+ oxidoreductase RnfC subunit [Xanthomonas campestris]